MIDAGFVTYTAHGLQATRPTNTSANERDAASAKHQEARSTPRVKVPLSAGFTGDKADQYLAARRELLSQLEDPKRSNASKTYLDIAHYDNDPSLIDTFA